jgi:hypothetical protein
MVVRLLPVHSSIAACSVTGCFYQFALSRIGFSIVEADGLGLGASGLLSSCIKEVGPSVLLCNGSDRQAITPVPSCDRSGPVSPADQRINPRKSIG